MKICNRRIDGKRTMTQEHQFANGAGKSNFTEFWKKDKFEQIQGY